ncbi:MAG: lysophospholipid acyltransferase family protein [Gemmatimonadota bacterium]
MRWQPGARNVARIAGPVLSLLTRTWRIETRNEARWRTLVDSKRPFLFLLWHEALLPLLWHHRRQGVSIVVSEAQDGRYLAEYALRLGYQEIRGSSTRGGVRALLGAVRALEEGGAVAFTPDGPRGPRREMKPGALAAAARSGALVLPIHAEADRSWRLRSWDRFMIPKPFARVRIGYGEPFAVTEADHPALLRTKRAMDDLLEELRWPDAAAMATA